MSSESSNARRKIFIEGIYRSSEFANMKENLYKQIKKLVSNKFERTEPITGVTREMKDQFYSD